MERVDVVGYYYYQLVKASSNEMKDLEVLDFVLYENQIHLDLLAQQVFLDCRNLTEAKTYKGFCMLVVNWPDINNRSLWKI
jgi:hypothetical protein